MIPVLIILVSLVALVLIDSDESPAPAAIEVKE